MHLLSMWFFPHPPFNLAIDSLMHPKLAQTNYIVRVGLELLVFCSYLAGDVIA
ncbi:hypothetical protein I79_026249 [Cricetulus griseus]|uniref:Uncharacterized protein n=1 Tax=Cricetulus griseus TaxID=10029 RepID=G3IQD0_CRIGR|nr:hypothetical protein I79_026249 [Cricetulus griseus]